MTTPTLIQVHGGLRLHPVRPTLWRVVALDDRIVGHLEERETPEGPVFVAKRFSTLHSTFTALGEFWSADDAVDSLRCA
ncbi:hypothetical protein D9V32_11100 [Mycetocola tolaasinivorans]|uniref:DNA mismatch repair protein n=1 Tax=Mycetocola tolaasinivorans TaxID=76635 RepID=A0A3L7A5Z0_9MICO|nr:hypothetical protein [Mycetocola tolaasinivorans]RLP74971.1 hypothetical protein D9V32_11100 [Mycetocola tolaasinivorans]